jgi:hypothetical protein
MEMVLWTEFLTGLGKFQQTVIPERPGAGWVSEPGRLLAYNPTVGRVEDSSKRQHPADSDEKSRLRYSLNIYSETFDQPANRADRFRQATAQVLPTAQSR